MVVYFAFIILHRQSHFILKTLKQTGTTMNVLDERLEEVYRNHDEHVGWEVGGSTAHNTGTLCKHKLMPATSVLWPGYCALLEVYVPNMVTVKNYSFPLAILTIPSKVVHKVGQVKYEYGYTTKKLPKSKSKNFWRASFAGVMRFSLLGVDIFSGLWPKTGLRGTW